MLQAAGWHIFDADKANIHAARGVAIRKFRDTLPTEKFPDRDWVPKTLIFARDDAHAEAIVEIVRVMPADDLKSVTPDAKAKDHFVIVDAVCVCEQDKTDSRPMEKKPSVAFDKLLQAVAFGNTEEEVITSVAGRLAHMEHSISAVDEKKIVDACGMSLKQLSRTLVEAVNPDRHIEQARANAGILPDTDQPIPDDAFKSARESIIRQAVKPLYDPDFRELLEQIKKQNEITINHVSQDQVIESEFSRDALDRARELTMSFEKFLEAHKDEITAFQILCNRPYKQRLDFTSVKELAEVIQQPPHLWNESQLWQAYAALEKSKVKDAFGKRILIRTNGGALILAAIIYGY